jgi:hypothetical protein
MQWLHKFRLCTKKYLISPRSGRLTIAQHFSAGNKELEIPSPWNGRLSNCVTLTYVTKSVSAVRSTDWASPGAEAPALKCWAIIGRPLRGLGRARLCLPVSFHTAALSSVIKEFSRMLPTIQQQQYTWLTAS